MTIKTANSQWNGVGHDNYSKSAITQHEIEIVPPIALRPDDIVAMDSTGRIYSVTRDGKVIYP